MNNLKVRRQLPFVWSVLFFLLLFSFASAANFEYTFYIFGFFSDSSSTETRQILSELPGTKTIVFYELNQRRHGERYTEIFNDLETKCNLQILPRDVEKRLFPPIIHFHNIMEYYKDYLLPLIGVFYEDRLVAIIVSQRWFNENFWEKLAVDAPTWRYLHIFVPSGEYVVENRTLAEELQELFTSERITFSEALYLTLETVLKDLCSPKFVTIIMVLLDLLYIFNVRKSLLVGISFSLVAYVSSLLTGLGFIISMDTTYAKVVVASLTIFVAIRQFMKNFNLKLKPNLYIDRKVSHLMGFLYIRDLLRLIAFFIIGFFTVIFLLSPNDGPYLLGLTTFTELKEFNQAYLLLILYCLIYVMPLLAISIIFHRLAHT